MDDDVIKAIREVRSIALENNQILKGMRRNARIATAWHIFYWMIIIGTGIASYYFVQPYVDKLTEAYKNIQAAQQKISNIPQSLNVDAIKDYLVGTGASEIK